MDILMIVTSHGELGSTGQKTGLWLEELAVPYHEFVSYNYNVDIASPCGGDAPIDPRSLEKRSPIAEEFFNDPNCMAKVHSSQPLARLEEEGARYSAYYVVGGHGIMWDAPDCLPLRKMLGTAFEEGRVVAAVCHGPAALLNVELSSRLPLVKGRRVTSFTNEEEHLSKMDTVVPFLLESRLREQGAFFESAQPGQDCTVQDGHLVTGQNAASAANVARKVISLLELQFAPAV